MHPLPIRLLGMFEISVWNASLLVAVIAGYPLFVWCMRLATGGGALPRLLPLRWVAIVYLAALSAQLFAHAVDAETSLAVPAGTSTLGYYLNPLAGPKTLYGVILFLPLISALTIAPPWRPSELARALDALTPVMLAVLTACRLGCFLQGCCFGVRSDHFGVRFPVGGPVYWHQHELGLITHGQDPLPVVPTQIIEAAVLALLFAVATRRLAVLRSAAGGVIFSSCVLAYSAARVLIEVLRDDPERNFLGPLSTSQWIGILVIVGLTVRSRVQVRGAAVPELTP